MANTFVATAAAALSWMFAEWIVKGHPSLLGALSGAIAGLVAVTPAAGYSGVMGALVLGLIVGVVCLIALHRDQERDSATTTRWTCSASTASAASSARSAPASWSTPTSAGTGVMNYETLKAAL